MKTLVSLIHLVAFFLCICTSANANYECGSYDRYALKFVHVYHASFETDIDGLIEEYKGKYADEKKKPEKSKVAREISSIIAGPANRNVIKLNLVSMTSNTKYQEKERLRLAEALRRSFGYKSTDKDFLDDNFIFGEKGAEYKDLQEDILKYTSAIGSFVKTRYIGDQIILSVENGKGTLEYKPYNKEEKANLLQNADMRIAKLVDYIRKANNQYKDLPKKLYSQKNTINLQGLSKSKAKEEKKTLDNNFYTKRKLLKDEIKMLKRKKKEIAHYKKSIAGNNIFQKAKPQRFDFEDPQVIRRVISSYIVKDRCLLEKMPDELLCILVGEIMSVL